VAGCFTELANIVKKNLYQKGKESTAQMNADINIRLMQQKTIESNPKASAKHAASNYH